MKDDEPASALDTVLGIDLTPTHPIATAAQVIPPAPPATADSRAGSNAELKALHADLTQVYSDYLHLAQQNPKLMNAAMLSQIAMFLKQNEIKGEAEQYTELSDLQKRLDLKRAQREEREKTMQELTILPANNDE